MTTDEQFWVFVDDEHVMSVTGPYALLEALNEAENQMNMHMPPCKVSIEKRNWP